MAHPGPDHGAAGTAAGPAHRAGGSGGFRGGSAPLDGEALLQLQAVRLGFNSWCGMASGDALRQGLRVALVGRPNVGKVPARRPAPRAGDRDRSAGHHRDLRRRDRAGGRADHLARHRRHSFPTMGGAAGDCPQRGSAVGGCGVVGAGWPCGLDRRRRGLAGAHSRAIPRILVANKADLPAGSSPAGGCSALGIVGTGRMTWCRPCWNGVALLEPRLLALNQRQRDLAARAADPGPQSVAAQQLPWDFWTIDLRGDPRAGEITGEELTEAVLDRVFRASMENKCLQRR